MNPFDTIRLPVLATIDSAAAAVDALHAARTVKVDNYTFRPAVCSTCHLTRLCVAFYGKHYCCECVVQTSFGYGGYAFRNAMRRRFGVAQRERETQQ